MKKSGIVALTVVCGLSVCGCAKKNIATVEDMPVENPLVSENVSDVIAPTYAGDSASSGEDSSAEDAPNAEEGVVWDGQDVTDDDETIYETEGMVEVVLPTEGDKDTTIAEDTTTAIVDNNTEPYEVTAPEAVTGDDSYVTVVTFRNDKLLQQHYEKHGIEMGFSSAEEYEYAAMCVVNNPAALHKIESEDGDDVYYVEETNEFVIVSTDGYIRTYFYPSSGIAYYNRQ